MKYEAIDDDGRVVRCRKTTDCEWCNEPIAAGTMAVVRVYNFDGAFNSARMHQECFAAAKAWHAGNPDGDWDAGEFGRGTTEEAPMCLSCGEPIAAGGYGDTGMCGPCCTGEAASLEEAPDAEFGA